MMNSRRWRKLQPSRFDSTTVERVFVRSAEQTFVVIKRTPQHSLHWLGRVFFMRFEEPRYQFVGVV